MLDTLLPLALVVGAFALMAHDATHADRRASRMVRAFALLAAGLVLRLSMGGGWVPTPAMLLVDLGTGLLVAAGMLASRRANGRALFVLGLLALAGGLLLFGVARLTAPEAATRGDATSLLVELGPDDHIGELAERLREAGVRSTPAFPLITMEMDADLAQVYLIEGDADRLARLLPALRRDVENVDWAAWNDVVVLDEPDADPVQAPPPADVVADDPLAARQWALTAIRAHAAHARLREAQPARKAVVAVIDTGVDAGHEDIGTVFGGRAGTTDANGHGTHCAGIAGAATNNGAGIASLNWEGRFVEVRSYPALGGLGQGTHEQIAQAILDATRDGADVLSLSFGTYSETPIEVISDAVAFALERGVIVVAAGGNASGPGRDHVPSNLPGVIAVSAVDGSLERARFSNTVGELAQPLAAPGVDIVSLAPGGGYVSKSGTSMATPLVAGLVGVMRALRPDLSASEAYAILHETGTELPQTALLGRLVDADAALARVLR